MPSKSLSDRVTCRISTVAVFSSSRSNRLSHLQVATCHDSSSHGPAGHNSPCPPPRLHSISFCWTFVSCLSHRLRVTIVVWLCISRYRFVNCIAALPPCTCVVCIHLYPPPPSPSPFCAHGLSHASHFAGVVWSSRTRSSGQLAVYPSASSPVISHVHRFVPLPLTLPSTLILSSHPVFSVYMCSQPTGADALAGRVRGSSGKG